MDLFSLDSVILIIVTCNCLPFSFSRSIFRRHISWQVLKIAFGSLQIRKSSGGGYRLPPSRFVPSALAVMPRVTKNLATPRFFFCQTKNIYALLRYLTNCSVTISFAVPFVLSSLQRPFDESASRFEAARLVSTACNWLSRNFTFNDDALIPRSGKWMRYKALSTESTLNYISLSDFLELNRLFKGAVSRNSAKLGNYKMPVKVGET